MRHDWNFAGIYVAPFAVHLGAALIVLLVLRPILARLRMADYMVNPPVVEASIYIIILAGFVVLL